MRISDWSSDVCSSDLMDCSSEPCWMPKSIPAHWRMRCNREASAASRATRCFPPNWCNGYRMPCWRPVWRSEEHTSELLSLMRHSYAVFRLQNNSIRTRHEQLQAIGRDNVRTTD